MKGTKRWLVPGMKISGTCHAAQITPSTRLPSQGPSRASSGSRMYPRQPRGTAEHQRGSNPPPPSEAKIQQAAQVLANRCLAAQCLQAVERSHRGTEDIHSDPRHRQCAQQIPTEWNDTRARKDQRQPGHPRPGERDHEEPVGETPDFFHHSSVPGRHLRPGCVGLSKVHAAAASELRRNQTNQTISAMHTTSTAAKK